MSNYNSFPDKILLEMISHQDEVAFRTLYERYWEKMFVVCHNRVADEDVAKDLLQDIFSSIWSHQNLIVIDNIEAYLYQSVKFSVVKYLNRRSKYDNVDSTTNPLLDRYDSMDMTEALHYKSLTDLIFQEVEKFPTQTKIIFKYSRIDHLDSGQIAEKLQISPRTVENQIGKALKRLRKFLQNVNFFTFFLF